MPSTERERALEHLRVFCEARRWKVISHHGSWACRAVTVTTDSKVVLRKDFVEDDDEGAAAILALFDSPAPVPDVADRIEAGWAAHRRCAIALLECGRILDKACRLLDAGDVAGARGLLEPQLDWSAAETRSIPAAPGDHHRRNECLRRPGEWCYLGKPGHCDVCPCADDPASIESPIEKVPQPVREGAERPIEALLEAARRVRERLGGPWIRGAATHVLADLLTELHQAGWRLVPERKDDLAQLLTDAAHHLRNLPGTRESDDIRWAQRLEQAAAGRSHRRLSVLYDERRRPC